MRRAARPIRNRAAAACLLALALCVKLIVPAGFMLATVHGAVTVTLCTGTGPAEMTMPMPMPMPMPASSHHGARDDGKPEHPCAFAGIAAPALSGADPFLLALAIAWIVASGIAVARVAVPAPPGFLRPPLRGPPATA